VEPRVLYKRRRRNHSQVQDDTSALASVLWQLKASRTSTVEAADDILALTVTTNAGNT